MLIVRTIKADTARTSLPSGLSDLESSQSGARVSERLDVVETLESMAREVCTSIV